MCNWFSTIVSKRVHRTPAFTLSSRLMLEQLEDRCVPSANMMMPMNMPMPPMNMSMPPMTMQAAITQLISAFDQMLPQFQASTPMQQFIEIQLFEILATDFAQMQMLGTMMGPMM